MCLGLIDVFFFTTLSVTRDITAFTNQEILPQICTDAYIASVTLPLIVYINDAVTVGYTAKLRYNENMKCHSLVKNINMVSMSRYWL